MSRELDREVAEKVLGHQLIYTPNGETNLYFGGDQETMPHYSTNIADAWRVLEEVGTDGCGIINNDQGKWAVVWDGQQNIQRDESDPLWTTWLLEDVVWCDTVPEAICHATLAATETNDDR